MKVFGLVLAVCVLVALFDVSHSITTRKPKTPTIKPTVRKPTVKPVNSIIATSTKPPASFICPGYKKDCYSYIVEPIYAINDGICKLFLNSCEFSNTNCDLLAQNLKAWERTSEQACKPLCPQCDELDLVCGALFNKRTIPFSSQCFMDMFSCLTGQPYTKVDLSECNLQVEKQQIYQ